MSQHWYLTVSQHWYLIVSQYWYPRVSQHWYPIVSHHLKPIVSQCWWSMLTQYWYPIVCQYWEPWEKVVNFNIVPIMGPNSAPTMRSHIVPTWSQVFFAAWVRPRAHQMLYISLDASEKERLLELRYTLIILSAHTKSERARCCSIELTCISILAIFLSR